MGKIQGIWVSFAGMRKRDTVESEKKQCRFVRVSRLKIEKTSKTKGKLRPRLNLFCFKIKQRQRNPTEAPKNFPLTRISAPKN
jgi:hypothetical protein